ncbi:TetR/AcrR family transcriptional regulator [Paenibacillus monticola]|uniref:TetR family transcriptional regulator n=1 Tax=Paenibacillus monticola TaxID=2666075 RepID=A0A7X2L041_9BACL|nr:TetR/AcrR family transcriptional regulator [Paenibacillus monticola]MRN51728.1 TetR family transcriptional regulator [Paenibacillus monticola]
MDRSARKDVIAAMHKENILLAAEGLFAANGVEGTTMDDIARTAEYSKRTVYVYFGSKEEIYYSIILRGITLLKDYVTEGLNTQAGFLSRYQALCQKLVDYYTATPFHFAAIVNFQTRPLQALSGTQVEQDIFRVGEEINAALEGLLENGKREGLLQSELLVKPTIFIYWSSLSSLILLAHHKSSYIEETMNIPTRELLEYGFQLLSGMVIKK